MMNNEISVIMSCYNETEKELSESINSILSQTFKNIEFIIVDDNPTNTTLKNLLIKYGNDKRVKLVFNDTNLGLAQSLNKAIDISTGEYIARMDADDIALPTRFEAQLEFLENNMAGKIIDLLRVSVTDGDALAANRLKGKSNTEIAKDLIVSVHTAKAHVCSILQKLCVDDRVQAAVKAVRENII